MAVTSTSRGRRRAAAAGAGSAGAADAAGDRPTRRSGRGAGVRGRADVRRGPGADRGGAARSGRARAGGWRRSSAEDELVAAAAVDPRPAPGAAARSGCSGRSSRCGRTWNRTAATSSCSGSTRAWPGSGCEGSCSDCAASAVTLELAIKQALEAGCARPRRARGRGRRVPPPPRRCLRRRRRPTAGAPASASTPTGVERSAARPGQAAASADGRPVVGALVVANVERHAARLPRHAARTAAERCTAASCGDGALALPAAAQRTFFLPRAGRSMDDERLQLEPVPLLRDRAT